MTKRIGLSQIIDFILKYLVLILIIGLITVTAIVEPRFMSPENLTNVMRQFGPLSFIALGMTFIILSGFIDLSIPGMISIIAMMTLTMVDVVGEVPALIIGLVLGVAIGAFNGTLLMTVGADTQAKVLFITFGMSQIFRSIALLYTGGFSVNQNLLEHPMPVTNAIGSGTWGPLSVSFWMFLLFLVVLLIFQSKTTLGKTISYIGGNLKAAELGGIPAKRIIIFVYALSGFMVAIGTIVLFSRVAVTVPSVGDFFERDAIMAVVVGGTSLQGGRGSVVRTFMGVTLVILLSNCMNLLGVPSHLQEVTRGAILVLAIWLDHRRHARG